MKLGKLTTVGVLLIVAALGVIPVAGATFLNQQEGLLCSDEVIRISFGNYVGDSRIEEVARLSDVAVLGEPGTSTFAKQTVSGATDKCGTRDDPALLSFLLDFEVEEYVKGTGPDHLTLILPADREDGSPVIQSGVPELVPGEKYLLLLRSKENGYAETYFGPDHYVFSDTPHNKWVISGDVAIKDRGWRPEQVLSVQTLRDRIANACDSPIQPGHEKAVLKNQECP